MHYAENAWPDDVHGMEFAFFIDSNDTAQFFLVTSAAARIVSILFKSRVTYSIYTCVYVDLCNSI